MAKDIPEKSTRTGDPFQLMRRFPSLFTRPLWRLTRGGETEYWSGGGIVADSDPKREVEETLWKAEQLSGLLNGSGL